jgi:hypothetical protein
MSLDSEHKKAWHQQNQYEGNGWSKYQLMVLQQLEDHNQVLQNLNKEVASIKQTIAVSDTELKMWRAQIMTNVVEITKDLDGMLYDERGLTNRVANVERELDVEEQANTKHKATLALYGSIVLFIVNVLVQVAALFLKQ